MIALDLQKTLISELKSLFNGQLFPAPRDTTDETLDPVPLHIYEQALPYQDSSELTDYMPYIAVRVQKGSQPDEDGPLSLSVQFDIGIFCDDMENRGHEYVCNIIETIRKDLFSKRLLDGKYYIRYPLDWELNEEDCWPYYFGNISTNWDLPIIVPEDPLL
jgi:hypothetical protein